jgi:hypothetical protein
MIELGRIMIPLSEKMFPRLYGRQYRKLSMSIQRVFFVTLFGVTVCTGLALADPLEVRQEVEETRCRQLATDYAKAPGSLSLHAIAQLQVCLARTLQNTASPPTLTFPRKFDSQPTRSSISIGNTTLPTPPTPPVSPQSIKIP